MFQELLGKIEANKGMRAKPVGNIDGRTISDVSNNAKEGPATE